MARIRTIKPEIWESEDIASVSVTATLTFIGLLTQADDEGRHRDHAAIIAGRLWALRQEHTPAHVARDLEELAVAGLICRYTGCDGRTYLHIVTWEKHQRIDRPSASRLPRCPQHQMSRKCAEHATIPCPAPHPSATAAPATPSRNLSGADSPDLPRGLDQPVSPDSTLAGSFAEAARGTSPAAEGSEIDHQKAPTGPPDESVGQAGFVEDSSHPREGSSSGSRILDPGSSRRGRAAPAPDAALERVSAKELVAEYVSGCHQRPPGNFIGQLGRNLKALLDEGFEPEHIRTALDRLRAKALHPSVLPSLVNEVVNPPALVAAGASSASGGAPWASPDNAYQPYFNPTPPPASAVFGRPL
ncbi:hypothetical protein [Streptomyces albipurpureus]|uniref:Phage or prophage related protein n=1 Tax=Streptomyces albipurpureus TaxID=2897419 RepID=A0ABT0UY07_9ACTN|nr:hypothetical protein [Streptomyces sp. CWNU-1]MCM2392036.1 hypothetical protein [Streptomyces sp. CWNU-1]